MRPILGITAEYDPFHRGHAYQLEQAKERVPEAACLAVMSGNFTQRGEPAVLDKWERGKIATAQGIDLVFELPFVRACRRAEHFAAGAVDILALAGATHISYGCEAEHPEDLEKLAGLLREHEEEFSEAVLLEMKEGCSRAKAGERASQKLFGDELTRLSLLPNNILALEYLKRIGWWREQGREITPVPVVRAGAGYREKNEEASMAGGTVLRKMVRVGEDIAPYLPWDPKDAHWEDQQEMEERLFFLLQGALLSRSPEDLAEIYSVGEGLENKLKKEIRGSGSYSDFLDRMTSRRYTASAIRRMLIHILLGIRGERIDRLDVGIAESHLPVYGRLLAAGPAGRKVLAEIKDLPLVVNANRTDHLTEAQQDAFALDLAATDLFHLICGRDPDAFGDRRRSPHIAAST